MDEERQETADWRIVWQMFFPCVISDLIGGCVEVLGHLEGNAGRTVSSFLTFAVIYPFYWRRIQKKKENRRIAEADGMTGQAAEAVSLCLKMPQGDMLAAALGKGASEGAAALFSGALWQQFFLMGIAAPLSEELLFRGILFERLRMALPFFWAALGSAAFFGLVHGNWAQGIYAALMGLILAWLYEKKNRLWEPVLFHSVANLTAMLMRVLLWHW